MSNEKYDFRKLDIELARLELEAATYDYVLKLKKGGLKEKLATLHDDIRLLKTVKKYKMEHGEEAVVKWLQGEPLIKHR